MDKACIVIVDDDEAVRQSLSSVLATYGFETLSFASAVQAIGTSAGVDWDCLILDVRMPDMDGLTALRLFQDSHATVPVIMITGHADVPMAVQAMKLGATDFLEKPVDDEALVLSIRSALDLGRQAHETLEQSRDLRERFATLTPREKDIAGLVVEGYSTAAIASKLDISARTVDHHRASILSKMRATSLPQLLKFLISARAGSDKR